MHECGVADDGDRWLSTRTGEVHPAGDFPFPFEVCYAAADVGATALRLVAAPVSSVVIPSGATWSISVRSVDGSLEAAASLPGTFDEGVQCGAACLRGTFNFGAIEAAPP